MASLTVTEQAVQDADAFLTAYLTSKIPDADFSEGSVTRDFVVKAIAYVFAFLRQEEQTIRDRQSLLSLSQLPESEDVDAAVDALLSNWFLTRKTGVSARLAVTLHFSRAADVTILPTTRFFKTTEQSYVLGTGAPVVIPATDLRPTVNADSTITDYTTTITMVAADAGTAGNVQPGRFTSADAFSPYFVYAENRVAGADGVDVETTADLLARAPTAISVRNLVNARSIDTVLRDTFPALTRLLTVGYGDPEMMRDLTQEAATRLQMHVGGHVDIYALLSRTDVTETLTVGGEFTRADGVVNVLRDDSADFLSGTAVKPFDVVRVISGLGASSREYIVQAVEQNSLTVSPRTAFSQATDEADPETFVNYVVGNVPPAFSDVRPLSATGYTSRKLQQANRVLLAARPHYKVKSVSVLDEPVVVLDDRINTGTLDELSYKVTVLNPLEAQSDRAVTAIDVHSTHNGKSLQVTYETLAGYEDIQSYVTDRFERTVCTNPLVRGYHPVYIGVTFSYRLKNNATGPVAAADVVAALEAYINSFDSTNNIDVSVLKQFVRDTFPNIGVILEPFLLTYTLYAPDGQLYEYSTKDVVSIIPDLLLNSASLTNGAYLRAPIPTDYNSTLKAQLVAMGVSDRTVRYLCEAADLHINQVA